MKVGCRLLAKIDLGAIYVRPPLCRKEWAPKEVGAEPGNDEGAKKKSDLVHVPVPPLSRLVPAVNALEVSLAHGGTGEPVKERKRNHVCESTRDGGTRCASKDDVVVSMEASRAKARCQILGASGGSSSACDVFSQWTAEQ